MVSVTDYGDRILWLWVIRRDSLDLASPLIDCCERKWQVVENTRRLLMSERNTLSLRTSINHGRLATACFK